MRMLHRLTPILVSALLLLLFAACNPAQPPAPACTEIGCSNELKIVIDGPLPSTYTIDLDVLGAETISLTCANGQSSEDSIHECRPDGAVFRDLAPDEVTVTLTWEGGIVSDTLRPAYADVQPNGPDCPPTCRQGMATLTMP